ncbi:hypothetical protein Rsub_06480 [Raphidocelis subcapitata]|uniref:Uncharacterized protein n=1 Tax=Raphidocelis subcapitata TaxID=307507 RepID=A0A2V0P8L8_9CHLO|nr:hypothetical protein Rsub_06480 [Raphidocelis subcapitata]|eukprot:GBF94210.1 hypothetical protein Rsub_06480 [Raphidocelis subcapitata]
MGFSTWDRLKLACPFLSFFLSGEAQHRERSIAPHAQHSTKVEARRRGGGATPQPGAPPPRGAARRASFAAAAPPFGAAGARCSASARLLQRVRFAALARRASRARAPLAQTKVCVSTSHASWTVSRLAHSEARRFCTL